MSLVDLRSDTVTRPTEQMRRAMARAEVGDDCYGEDPTVNRLQERAAQLLGMQAAMYVPTGTMANQIALRVLSRPGTEVVCEADCHLVHHESGAAAVLSQVQLRTVEGHLGVLEPGDVSDAIRPADPFQPDTSVVAVENTHNTAGGTVWSLEQLRAVASAARDAGLPLFCDGARLFNACVATGTAAADFAAQADVVTISLYKGLCAPMGSLVCGSTDVIERAWLARRIFGGALRQAGHMAAAGLIALEPDMVDRLRIDHEHARMLAEELAEAAPEATVDVDRVHTNMVLFDAARARLDPTAVLTALRGHGVLAGLIAPGVIRFVTHRDVDEKGIRAAGVAFRRVLKEVT